MPDATSHCATATQQVTHVHLRVGSQGNNAPLQGIVRRHSTGAVGGKKTKRKQKVETSVKSAGKTTLNHITGQHVRLYVH